MDGFETFWTAYPRKRGKDRVAKWFKSRKPNSEDVKKMLTAIEQDKKTQQWQKDGGQFIPYPERWLNCGDWKDVSDAVPVAKPAAKYLCEVCRAETNGEQFCTDCSRAYNRIPARVLWEGKWWSKSILPMHAKEAKILEVKARRNG